jgi:hypothetical protein
MMKVHYICPFSSVSQFFPWGQFPNFDALDGLKVNIVNDGPVTMQLDSSQSSKWVPPVRWKLFIVMFNVNI